MDRKFAACVLTLLALTAVGLFTQPFGERSLRPLTPDEMHSLKGAGHGIGCCLVISECTVLPDESDSATCKDLGTLACTRYSRYQYVFTAKNNKSCSGTNQTLQCTWSDTEVPCIVKYRCIPDGEMDRCMPDNSVDPTTVFTAPESCSPDCPSS